MATENRSLLIEIGLLSYSGIKGAYFIEREGVTILENISKLLEKKLKADKIKCPLFLPASLLSLESSFKDFKKECFKLQNKDKYLKPTSELLLLDKVKKDIFNGKEVLRYYMDGSVFRNETKQNEPGIRHDQIMYFMEGHYFSNILKEVTIEFNRVQMIYDVLFKKLEIPFFKTYRLPADRFPGSCKTLAYNYITSKGKILQLATIHNIKDSFTRLKNLKKAGKEVYSCCYGLSERVLFPLVDAVPNMLNPVVDLKEVSSLRVLNHVHQLFSFIRVSKEKVIVNMTTRERLPYDTKKDVLLIRKKLSQSYKLKLCTQTEYRNDKYLFRKAYDKNDVIGVYKGITYWGDLY